MSQCGLPLQPTYTIEHGQTNTLLRYDDDEHHAVGPSSEPRRESAPTATSQELALQLLYAELRTLRDQRGGGFM